MIIYVSIMCGRPGLTASGAGRSAAGGGGPGQGAAARFQVLPAGRGATAKAGTGGVELTAQAGRCTSGEHVSDADKRSQRR